MAYLSCPLLEAGISEFIEQSGQQAGSRHASRHAGTTRGSVGREMDSFVMPASSKTLHKRVVDKFFTSKLARPKTTGPMTLVGMLCNAYSEMGPDS